MLERTLFKVDKQQLDVYDLLDSIEPLINELDNFQDEWSDKRTILHNEIQNDRILNAGQLKTDFASNLIDMLNINNKKNELHDRISSIIASALSMLVEILIEVINDQDDTPVATRNSIRLKSATLLKSQSVAAQTAKNAIFLVWTDFLPCVG